VNSLHFEQPCNPQDIKYGSMLWYSQLIMSCCCCFTHLSLDTTYYYIHTQSKKIVTKKFHWILVWHNNLKYLLSTLTLQFLDTIGLQTTMHQLIIDECVIALTHTSIVNWPYHYFYVLLLKFQELIRKPSFPSKSIRSPL